MQALFENTSSKLDRESVPAFYGEEQVNHDWSAEFIWNLKKPAKNAFPKTMFLLHTVEAV